MWRKGATHITAEASKCSCHIQTRANNRNINTELDKSVAIRDNCIFLV